jgi:hypothetical protein
VPVPNGGFLYTSIVCSMLRRVRTAYIRERLRAEQGLAFSTPKKCWTRLKHVHTMYRPCSNTYIQCTAHVQTCIFNSKFIGHCLYNVYTHTYCFSIYVCVHTCLALVHAIHIPGTYIKCTKTYCFVHVLKKQKYAAGENRTQDLAQSIQPP